MPSAISILRTGLFAMPTLTNSKSYLHSRQMTTDACADVHVFLAKGNNEPYPGRQGKLVTAICSGLSSCDYEDVQMNNMLEDPYCGSVYEGATNGYAQVVAYNKRCPSAKLVVSGYSQGAHVVGDILGGGGGTFFQDCVENSTPNLDPSVAPGNMGERYRLPAAIRRVRKESTDQNPGELVAAVLTFGDVRHTANQPYNFQSGAGDEGLFPRTDAMKANIDKFTSVYRDYCVSTDPICAGGDDISTHLSYFEVFTGEAAAWVLGKLNTTSATTSSSTSIATSRESTTTSTLASSTLASITSSKTSNGGTVTSTTSSTSATTSTSSSETTTSTTGTVSTTPTNSAAASTTSSGVTSARDQTNLFGLVVAAAFALFLV